MVRVLPKAIRSYPWYVRALLWLQRRRYGRELEPSKIWARSPRLFLSMGVFFGALDRKSSPLDPQLRALITVRVSQINACSFCVDINSALVLRRGGSDAKLEALGRFRECDLFSEAEKVALEYAEAMTFSDREVSEELFSKVRIFYNDDQVVELTGLIAFQNCSSKFNAALDIPAQGFCRLQK